MKFVIMMMVMEWMLVCIFDIYIMLGDESFIFIYFEILINLIYFDGFVKIHQFFAFVLFLLLDSR